MYFFFLENIVYFKFVEGEGWKIKMELCNVVEREVDCVLLKFGGFRDYLKKNLEELILFI